MLLKPLPYPDADALVSIWNTTPAAEGDGRIPLSATQWFTYRADNAVFDELGLWSVGRTTVTGRPEPEEIEVLRVTDGTLQTLGVRPAFGRWFTGEDDSPASAETVVMTDGYWKRHHGGAQSVIGRTLIVDGVARTIIGVMPPEFRFLNSSPDLIVPLRINPNALVLGAFNYQAVGRLKRGVTLQAAAAELARLNDIWLNTWPSPAGFEKERFARMPVLQPLKQGFVGDVSSVLWLAMAMVITLTAPAKVDHYTFYKIGHSSLPTEHPIDTGKLLVSLLNAAEQAEYSCDEIVDTALKTAAGGAEAEDVAAIVAHLSRLGCEDAAKQLKAAMD